MSHVSFVTDLLKNHSSNQRTRKPSVPRSPQNRITSQTASRTAGVSQFKSGCDDAKRCRSSLYVSLNSDLSEKHTYTIRLSFRRKSKPALVLVGILAYVLNQGVSISPSDLRKDSPSYWEVSSLHSSRFFLSSKNTNLFLGSLCFSSTPETMDAIPLC